MVDKSKKNIGLGLLLMTLVTLASIGLVSAEDGTALYASNCEGCHGPLATSAKLNRTAEQIQTAINNNVGGMGILSTLNSTDIQAIADALSTTAPTDVIAPVTTISGVIENGSYNNSVTVMLNATDNEGGSGVNETIYMVNGGPTTTYSGPFIVDTIGQDNVTYWSTDNAGNVEPQNMVNFTIVSVENGTALYASNCERCHGPLATSAKLNRTAEQIQTAINNNVGGMGILSTLSPTDIQAIADALSTTAPTDVIAPVTTISGVTENGSYNNSVTVMLNATDNEGGSGVNETIYMVNGGPTTTYSGPFIVDTIGQDNVIYWSTDNAGNVEPQNMVNFTIVNISEVIRTAIREIGNKSILPGESTEITIRIDGFTNALALQEILPEGWNVTRGSDDADAFKNRTNEWVWMNIGTNTTVTYTLTAPTNISIGTYQIEGTINDANGILANVSGDNLIKIDILEFYRRLGDDPAVVETRDLLRAFDDFRNNITPQGFDRPLSEQEVDELINEWEEIS